MVLKRILETGTARKNWLNPELLIRSLVHAALLLPFFILVFDWFTQNLTADPIQATMQRTGQFAIIWLILSLACTPMYILFDFLWPLKFKRMLGLYAFFYAALHFLTFLVLDYRLNFSFIFADINNKRYIFAGLLAFIILTALAITTPRFIKKRMGKNWKRLHRLVYAAGLLAVVHYIWVVKADIRQPLFYTVILIMLLLLRVPFIRDQIIHFRKTFTKAR